MKLILKYDSRDKVFQNRFGQTIHLPDELNFDTPQHDDIQPIGDVKCTCYTTCDIAEDQKKMEFDILDLWQRIPSNQLGADPRDVLKEAVKNGLLPKGQTERIKDWKSFWSALGGVRDSFDNVRSALVMSNSPVFNASYWYAEWGGASQSGILPMGKTPLNGHAYCIEGWKQVNGEPMLIIEAWLGRKLLMPRDVFNEAMKPYGMQSWVLSTSEIDAKRQKTILEAIKDACINTIILMKQLLVLKKAEETVLEPVPQPKESKLEAFCLAIRDYEGKPGDLSYRNNNPGNLRSVQGPFLKFPTYEDGWKALLDYVTRAATGKHKAYKPEFTITQFFNVYAPSADHNHPDIYAKWVAKRLDIPTTTKIKDLL